MNDALSQPSNPIQNMKNVNAFLKSNYFKIMMPIVLVWGAIKLIKAGYAFGQWLFIVTH
jgi:hypothetical protein